MFIWDSYDSNMKALKILYQSHFGEFPFSWSIIRHKHNGFIEITNSSHCRKVSHRSILIMCPALWRVNSLLNGFCADSVCIVRTFWHFNSCCINIYCMYTCKHIVDQTVSATGYYILHQNAKPMIAAANNVLGMWLRWCSFSWLLQYFISLLVM